MNPSFREILTQLSQHGVDFVIVGGVAAVIHGAPVTTFDLDALVRVSEENARKLIRALTGLDARYREHRDVIRPTEADVMAGGHMLLMTSAGPLDILGYIGDGDRFEDLLDATVEVEMSGGTFMVLSLDELMRQKRVSDRAKDRAVIELLESLAQRLDSDD